MKPVLMIALKIIGFALMLVLCVTLIDVRLSFDENGSLIKGAAFALMYSYGKETGGLFTYRGNK